MKTGFYLFNGGRRHEDLSTVGNYSPVGIYDHKTVNISGSKKDFLLVGMSTGTDISYLRVYTRTNIPLSTGKSYVGISTANWISWTTDNPLTCDILGEKAYIAAGDDNPYVLYYDSGWKVKQLPICYYMNDGVTTGAGIIDNTTGSGNVAWNGSKIVGAVGHFLFLSDGLSAYYGLKEGAIDPSRYIENASVADQSSGILESWYELNYIGLNPNLQHYKAISYKKYIYFCGYEGFQVCYPRFVQGRNDYDLITENYRGVYGGITINKNGVFFVGKDGIYGYDTQACWNLSKKIWPQIESEHSTIPDDLKDSSITEHDGYIWVSFPNGTNKEVYIFEPDHIYSDERNESHAPFYRFTYTDGTTSRSAMGFEHLKSFDGHLYGVNGNKLYELDYGGFDKKSTLEKNGISFNMKSAYYDMDNPGVKKIFNQAVLEVDEGICDGTTGGITDLRMAFSADYSTSLRTITSTGILDVEYITGDGRGYVTVDVPETTDYYSLDGNSMSFEIIGESSGTLASGEVYQHNANRFIW